MTYKITFRIFSEIDEPLDFNENMRTNLVLDVVSLNAITFFCGNCYLTSYLASKLFIPYVILKKLRFQYFLSIACYTERKFILECVPVIPIDDLTDILS